MSHARQQIREAVATLLRVSPTTWGSVFETRLPKKRTTADFLMVFADGEASVNQSSDAPAFYLRSCNLAVVGHLRLPGNTDTETVEDRMDAMAAEIETKLTFTTLRAQVAIQQIHLLSTEMVVIVDSEDAPDHAELTLSFVAEYATQAGLPEALI